MQKCKYYNFKHKLIFNYIKFIVGLNTFDKSLIKYKHNLII